MNVNKVRDYINRAIGSFVDDPADNDFQRGFLAAMEAIHHDLFLTEDGRIAEFDRQNAAKR